MAGAGVRVAPPELMGGSSRETRATSGNSAICKTCTRKQIENVARPDDRRIDPGGTPRERNPAEVRRHDLEQDTETEAYTSG